jgi:hypothetical protein
MKICKIDDKSNITIKIHQEYLLYKWYIYIIYIIYNIIYIIQID